MRLARLGEKGMALVLTLVVIAIITAVVVEFAYGVYINTSSLLNWQTNQRLSLASTSVVRLARKTIMDNASRVSYTYPGFVEMLYENPLEVQGHVTLRVEDENSKFNLNKIVLPNGLLDDAKYKSFRRLLGALEIDPVLADTLVDWIDPDSEPRPGGWETDAKNAPLSSVDELLLVKGVSAEIYAKLSPYVTIFGGGLVNINGAETPVLMSLSEKIDRTLAERLMGYRETTHFENPQDIQKVAGFETIGTGLMGQITVKGSAFRIISTATSGNIKRIIECAMDSGGVVKYWKEY